MSNTLEYILSLNDKMSSKLSRIGISSDGALSKFAKLQQQANATSKMMQEMGVSSGSLKQKLDLLKNEREWIPANNMTAIKQYNREINQLEKQIGRLESTSGGWGSKLKDSLMQIPGIGVLTNPIVAVGAAVGGIVKLGADAEQTRVSFQTMLQSVSAGNKMITDINAMGAATPFNNKELQDNAKLLLNMQVSADKVIPTLKMLGDVSGGNSERLNGLTLAYSQVQSAGKLQGQDLMQMINAGFNPLNEISRVTGQSMSKLKDQMSKGAISAQMVEKAFQSATGKGGMFYQMMDKQSQTLSGKWSTFVDVFVSKLSIVGEQMAPFIGNIISYATSFAEVVGSAFTSIINITSSLVSWFKNHRTVTISLAVVIGTITTLLLAHNAAMYVSAIRSSWLVGTTKLQLFWSNLVAGATSLWTAAQWALNVALNANPIGLIIIAITALVALIVMAIRKYNEWGAAILFLTGPIGMVINAIMALKNNWESVKKAFSTGGILAGLKRIGVVLLDTVLYPIQQLLQMLSKIPGLGKLAGKGSKFISEIRQKLDLVTPESKKTVEKVVKTNEKIVTTGTGKGKTGTGTSKGGSTDTKLENKKSNEAIATGGTKTTHIVLNFKNIIETQLIKGKDFKEAAQDMQAQATDGIVRALQMALTTAG